MKPVTMWACMMVGRYGPTYELTRSGGLRLYDRPEDIPELADQAGQWISTKTYFAVPVTMMENE
jgi:hypothetical protein